MEFYEQHCEVNSVKLVYPAIPDICIVQKLGISQKRFRKKIDKRTYVFTSIGRKRLCMIWRGKRATQIREDILTMIEKRRLRQVILCVILTTDEQKE